MYVCRASIYPYYESIGRYCGYVRKALKVTKSCVLKFKYSSLGELFHTTGTNQYIHTLKYTYIQTYIATVKLVTVGGRVGEPLVFKDVSRDNI